VEVKENEVFRSLYRNIHCFIHI